MSYLWLPTYLSALERFSKKTFLRIETAPLKKQTSEEGLDISTNGGGMLFVLGPPLGGLTPGSGLCAGLG